MMLPWIMLINIGISIVLILCIVNLWDSARDLAQHRGGWKKLDWFVWLELIVATPFVAWMIWMGMSGGLL